MWRMWYNIDKKEYPLHFKNPETKFRRNEDCNSKSRTNVKKHTYDQHNSSLSRISLHKSNFEIAKNRKLNVSKHLYECSQCNFEVLSIYETNDYTLFQ